MSKRGLAALKDTPPLNLALTGVRQCPIGSRSVIQRPVIVVERGQVYRQTLEISGKDLGVARKLRIE